jgi:hypothetical protein
LGGRIKFSKVILAWLGGDKNSLLPLINIIHNRRCFLCNDEENGEKNDVITFLAAEVQVVQADGGYHLQEPQRAFTEETREQEGQEAGSPREAGNHSGSEVRAFFQCCGCF